MDKATLQSLTDEQLADMITKKHDGDFDVQRAVEDQLWQQRNYQTRAQPQPQASDDYGDDHSYVTMRNLYQFCDILGEESGKNEKRLHNEIRDEIKAAVAPLLKRIEEFERGETTLPKFLDKRDNGNVTSINKGSKVDVKSA